jgi:hypothetical protein
MTEGERVTMGSNGRRYYEQNYSPPLLARSLLEYLCKSSDVSTCMADEPTGNDIKPHEGGIG